MSDLKKPVMRGLHGAVIKRNLIAALTVTTAVVVVMKIFRNDQRKNDYAEFYKTYDANAAFERMRKAGVISCAK